MSEACAAAAAAVALAVCANNAAELFAFPSPRTPNFPFFPFYRWPAFVCACRWLHIMQLK